MSEAYLDNPDSFERGAMVRSSPPLMTVHVLVIDDDVRLFEVLDSYLTQNSVRATHASNGLAGLAALESGAFDAVLLDVMMPGMDGLAVLKTIRDKSRLPVLMVTAKGDETDRVVGVELGAEDR